MTDKRLRTAAQKDHDVEARARALGIDAAYVSTLVDEFYTRIRQHPRLGPIFERAIGDDWPPHLVTMKTFWRSVALGTREYDGRPVPKHMKVGINDPELFTDWLGLFKQTLEDTAPSPDAEMFFLERAANIAQSLKFAIFGLPRLQDAPPA